MRKLNYDTQLQKEDERQSEPRATRCRTLNDIVNEDELGLFSTSNPAYSKYLENIRGIFNHKKQRQGDEYFCSCGVRWAVTDEDPHPPSSPA